MHLNTLKNHSCVKLRNNIFLMTFMSLKKENKGLVYIGAKCQELALRSLFLRWFFHISLHKGITTSQLPLFLFLSLYSKIKIQYLKD